MNSSFPGLTTTLAVPLATPGSGINTELIQQDGEAASVFVGIFGEACSALSPPLPPASATAPDTEALLSGLQDLPQGGKLLPLLQQTLDSVAASGIDLKQFVERLTTALHELARSGDATAVDLPAADLPAGQLAMALQQLVQEQPALRQVLPAEIVDVLDRGTAAAGKVAGEQLLRNLSVHAQPNSGESADPSQTVQQQPAGGRPFTADPSVSALFQPPAGADNDNTVPDSVNMTVLLAAMKRLSPDTPRSTSTDATPVSAPAPSATAASAPAAPAPAPVVAVNTPLGQADWDQALGERIQWLAGQKMQGAQVKLNPASLGPMEVRIQVQNDQASVQFTAHHAVVREALEAALPRLREMFEASGVQLVNVDVSGQSFTGQQRAMQDTTVPHSGAGNFDDELIEESGNHAPLAAFMASDRLDLFA
jgi:Flagellar hook-length control protein FliK